MKKNYTFNFKYCILGFSNIKDIIECKNLEEFAIPTSYIGSCTNCKFAELNLNEIILINFKLKGLNSIN